MTSLSTIAASRWPRRPVTIVTGPAAAKYGWCTERKCLVYRVDVDDPLVPFEWPVGTDKLMGGVEVDEPPMRKNVNRWTRAQRAGATARARKLAHDLAPVTGETK